MKKSVFTPFLLSVVAVLTACGGSTKGNVQNNPPPTVTVSSVTLSCTTPITTAQTSQCTGTVHYSDSTLSNKVSYALAPGSIGSVTATGVASSGTAGTVSVVATSTEKTTVSSSPSSIVVNAITITVSSVTLSCTTPITTAQTSQCTGTVHYSDSTLSNKVSYALAPGSIGSVTATGVYSSAAAGTGQVIATSTENTGVSSLASSIAVTAVAVTVKSVSVTATPSSVTVGQTSNCAGIVLYSDNSTSNKVSYTATHGTIASTGLYTATTVGAGSCTATSTEDTSQSNSAAITVTAAVVTVKSVAVTCVPITITTLQTSVCTATTTYSDGNTKTGLATFTTTLGAITPAGVLSSAAAGSASVIGTSTENTAISSPAFVVTVTSSVEQLSAASPRAQWVVGQATGNITITFNGNGIPATIANGDLSCTPAVNVQGVQWINSGQVKYFLAVDQVYEGSKDHLCSLRRSDGTRTNAVPFGLYGQRTCSIDPASGEKFCLNPQKVVAGQHLSNGQPLNGYVDTFNSNGSVNGSYFVGSPTSSIAVEPLKQLVSVDGGNTDENGGFVGTVSLQGFYPQPVTGVAAKNGIIAFIQPAATENISWYSDASTPATVMHANVGAIPQSIDLMVAGGKTFIVVVTSGTVPAVWKIDTSNPTSIVSQTIVGASANLLGGSALTMFDSLGIGVITSFGDNLAIPFSETTLQPAGNEIALTGISVSATADTANGVVIIGNVDPTNPGGGFATVNPVTGATATIPSATVPFLPVGVVPNSTGKTFYACPQDGVSPCSSFTLP